MKIHELRSITKRAQRVGRSGKRGSYSGRGVKGQKSRSGRRLRPAERDLILRIPKQRGYANAPKDGKAVIVNLDDISTALKGQHELNHDVLRAAGLIKKGYRGEVKLLGDGEIAFALRVRGIKVSASAAAKIKKAGGSLE